MQKRVHTPGSIPVANQTEVDWRGVDQGGPQTGPKNDTRAPRKDQGTCGSCWSYGSTGTIEGQGQKTTGQLVSLSQQNLMDCTWLYGNNACDGGLDYLAFAWMLEKNNGQIATAESYGGYLNQDGFCHFGPVADQDGGMKMVDTNPWTHQSFSWRNDRQLHSYNKRLERVDSDASQIQDGCTERCTLSH